MPLEFRVRWQRRDRRAKSMIYQDFSRACRKLRAIKATEELKGEFPRIANMPDLVEAVLEVREVGKWSAHTHQPKPYDFESMREWLESQEPCEDEGMEF